MLKVTPQDLKDLLNHACEAAALQTLPRFRADVEVTNKLQQDFDPVTVADQEAERSIRELITAKYPDHGIVGEEFGSLNPSSPYQWIIDPIDGTRAFISGIPVWGTLVGIYENGHPIAGVMDQPFTGERYLAVDGTSELSIRSQSPTTLQTSSISALRDATLMTTSPHILRVSEDVGYFEVEKQVKLFRYGCDCYAYCLLAAGNIDLVIESGLNVYDIAALIPIVQNAGGIVSNWQGGPAAEGGQILASANSELHREAIEALNHVQV